MSLVGGEGEVVVVCRIVLSQASRRTTRFLNCEETRLWIFAWERMHGVFLFLGALERFFFFLFVHTRMRPWRTC